MKKILLRSLFFLFPLITVTCLYDFLVGQYLKNTDAIPYKRWNMLYNPIEADVLVVGNSRAGFHVDPLLVDSILHVKSYNLGMSGGPIEISDVAWKLYRSHNKKIPRLVLCNVDFLWLGAYHMPYDKKNYLIFLKDPCFSELVEEMDISFFDLYVPGMKYRGDYNLMLNFVRDRIGSPEKGNTIFKKGAILVKRERDVLKLAVESRSFERGKERIDLFYRFLDECQEEGIQVVLFKSPIQQIAYKDLSNIEDSFVLIDSVSSDRRLPLLDYTDFMIEDNSCFYDPVHLNYKGAEFFSVRLAHDVDSLLTEMKIKL